ncbi:MAG: hypothetical protein SOR23_06590 [Candidatus Enterosoma sp.]|nr:hypothetical protein [Bacilli bacterium]MDY3047877.1 hypothetical protein [Candidatus Enterosoma sp.]
MMKKKLILASVLTIALLCSCNNGKESSSVNSGKPSNTTEKETTTPSLPAEELTEEMLIEASSGVAVESKLVNSTVTDAGGIAIVAYNSCLLDYETTIDEYAFRLYSDKFEEGYYKVTDPIPFDTLKPNRNTISMMRDYIEDNDGFLVDRRLTKKNEIIDKYGRKDGSTNDKVGVSFSTVGFYNFFSSFTASDFVKGETKNTFVLDTEHMQEPESLTLTASALTAGIAQTALKSLTVYTDGYHITSYDAVMEPVVNTDLIPGYVITQNMYARGTLKGIGKDDDFVTRHFLKKNEGTKKQKLEDILLKLKQGNYTETLSFQSRDDEGEAVNAKRRYQRVDSTMVVSELKNSKYSVTDSYYITEEGKKQKLRYLNDSFYKEGKEVVNDIAFPDFDIDTVFFTETDGTYLFTMVDSGVGSLTASAFTNYEVKANLVSLEIKEEENTVSMTMKGKDNTSSEFVLKTVYSDIGTTDNGIDVNNLKSSDELTWKDLLSTKEYNLATSNIAEKYLNMIPTLNNGYFDATATKYNNQLRLDYILGNVYTLFDEDQNEILSKKETEKYYSFRDTLYSYYQSALEKNGFSDIVSTKENEHITKLTAKKEVLSLQVSIIEDATTRDLTFRIGVEL